MTRCSGIGNVCANVRSEVPNRRANWTCTWVVPAANGPWIVTRLPSTEAEGEEPSRIAVPEIPDGRSMISGPPMSTRLRAVFTISST